MPFKNLPENKPVSLASLIDCKPGQVSSMGLVRDAGFDAVLLAFAAGESVSEEAYPGDVLYLLLEGSARVVLPGGSVRLEAGQVLCVRAQVEHAVEGAGDGAFKLLQILLAG